MHFDSKYNARLGNNDIEIHENNLYQTGCFFSRTIFDATVNS